MRNPATTLLLLFGAIFLLPLLVIAGAYLFARAFVSRAPPVRS